MSDKIKQYKERIVKGTFTAVDQLIMVLESPILSGDSDGFDTVAAEKMKTAAAAKRLAQEDALAMLDTANQVEEELKEEDESQEEKTEVKADKTDFKRAEKRATGRT